MQLVYLWLSLNLFFACLLEAVGFIVPLPDKAAYVIFPLLIVPNVLGMFYSHWSKKANWIEMTRGMGEIRLYLALAILIANCFLASILHDRLQKGWATPLRDEKGQVNGTRYPYPYAPIGAMALLMNFQTWAILRGRLLQGR